MMLEDAFDLRADRHRLHGIAQQGQRRDSGDRAIPVRIAKSGNERNAASAAGLRAAPPSKGLTGRRDRPLEWEGLGEDKSSLSCS